MQKKLVNPETLYDGAGVGMSQAVVDLGSGLVFISGQVDWNHQHQVSSDSVSDQLARALEKLKIALHASGASVETLLQVRVYVRGELEEHMESIVPILASFLGNSRPAVTGIGVASLASKATLVEVEAIARSS
ncbi:MAG TPA: RidA family protein [Terrimicrobiaceae bacterium]|jgi:2-iminobutanoate/2-iminopropanoate deaminase|nr:RidA family protein [Terrimicrobiaceae bacterium]